MYKKVMTFTDFDGNTRTETFWFNLTEAEVVELEMGVSGGLTNMLERIVAAQDSKSIVETFKKLILMSYGEKTPDGRGFRKSKEIADAFMQTQAYSDLFMELSRDANAASEFFKGVIPVKQADNQPAVLTVKSE